jgi:urease accessory protein
MAPVLVAQDLEAEENITAKEHEIRLKPASHIATTPPLPPSAEPNTLSDMALPGSQATKSTSQDPLHMLIMLADSQLPIGSFAFSSGLESFLAHRKLARSNKSTVDLKHLQNQHGSDFITFLELSLLSVASLSLPFVMAAYRQPERILGLDDECDAMMTCTVGRRASVSQGRALLGIWERSFAPSLGQFETRGENADGIGKALQDYAQVLRTSATSSQQHGEPVDEEGELPLAHAHFAPIWGAITRALGLSQHSSAYTFLFNHARAVVSAAVRASVLGPYSAQAELSRPQLQRTIEGLVKRFWDTETKDTGQRVPVVDLWVGRHEKLYSRIFNS